MKKLAILFLLISITTAFCQTLKFDIMAKYSTKAKTYSAENSIYGISTNSNYFMRVLNSPNGNQTAIIFDLESFKKHEYNIRETKLKDNSVAIKFVYLNTSSFTNYDFHSTVTSLDYDFEKISEDNETETVKLILYKDQSKKRIIKNYELNILKSEFNLFPLFRFACFQPYKIFTELNYDKPGLVTSCISDDGSKFMLTTFGEANLEVELPNL